VPDLPRQPEQGAVIVPLGVYKHYGEVMHGDIVGLGEAVWLGDIGLPNPTERRGEHRKPCCFHKRMQTVPTTGNSSAYAPARKSGPIERQVSVA
jgi:hypothetical protein